MVDWRAVTLRIALCTPIFLLTACHEQPPPPGPGGHHDPAMHQSGGAPMRLWSFEENSVGKLPSGWSPVETNSDGTPATWSVAGGEDSAQGERYLRVATPNTGSTYNLLLSIDPQPADLELAVWVRADSGKEDRGGGLLWRAQDENHYWITRWNPLEKNLRLYVVEKGARRTLASAEIDADPAAWHELRVVARGARATVFFNGAEVLSHEDAALPKGGRIGFWTKADAATSFDALTLAITAPDSGSVPGPQPR